MPSVIDVIVHCQKQIKKEPPAEKLIHYLNRLDRLRVVVQDLMATGVGRTVNQLSRHDGEVGRFASKLVKKWKAMVSDENSEDSDSQSSSSSQSDEDAGEEEDSDHDQDQEREKADHYHRRSSPVVKEEHDRDHVPIVNGRHHHKHSRDEPVDEFHHSADSDDDEDRLCIDDEDGRKGIKNESSPCDTPLLIIKQQTVSENSSGEETDVCDDDMDLGTNQVDYNPIEDSESSKFSPPPPQHNFKSERLSESDNSSDEEDLGKYASTQPVNPKSHNKEVDDDHHQKKIKLDGRGHRKDVCNNKIVEDHHESKHNRENRLHKTSSSVSESKNSRHSVKDKHKKDRHQPAEMKEHKKDKEVTPSLVKVKVEPPEHLSEDSLDSEERQHPSKHKEKKSKRSKEKKKTHSSDESRKSKDHKSDKKEKHSDSHKMKSKLSEKEKRDSHRKDGERSKRKNDESSENGRVNSQSPDRKKLKLEDSSRHKKAHTLTKKPSIHIDEEINSESGVKFEELLGCLDKNLTKGTDRHKEKEKSKKHSSSSGKKNKDSKEEVTKLVRRNDVKKKPEDKRKKHLESIIAPTALNISPNYKPPLASTMIPRPILPMGSKPNLNILESCDPGNYWEDSRMTANTSRDCINNTQDDALSTMMSGRNQRTKVFSGRAIACTGVVPRLFDMCMQVIQDNIGDLGYTGGVPFEILKPALERATAQQLLQIEEYNPYLIGTTDELWRFHCNREFRGKSRQEMETWRELYERETVARDMKLEKVRNMMLKKSEVAAPVRKAKLAYVEPVGGPRFSREKAATIKNGMRSLKIKEEKGPKKGVGSSASVGFNNPTDSSKIVHEQAVLINPESRAAGHSRGGGGGGGRGGGGGDGESSAKSKPRKAPLMARTMKFIRTLQRR